MDTQKIEKLYELLERAEKEHDIEAAAALRLAIFSLENWKNSLTNNGGLNTISAVEKKIFTKVKRCDMCKKESDLADTFIFKGKAYCMNCLYDLIMEMAEDGNVNLTFDNCEENGILVNF